MVINYCFTCFWSSWFYYSRVGLDLQIAGFRGNKMQNHCSSQIHGVVGHISAASKVTSGYRVVVTMYVNIVDKKTKANTKHTYFINLLNEAAIALTPLLKVGDTAYFTEVHVNNTESGRTFFNVYDTSSVIISTPANSAELRRRKEAANSLSEVCHV